MNNEKLENKLWMQLLSRNYQRIYNYILMLVPNRNEADDIMQETVIIMYEKSDLFQVGTDFLSWSIVIAKYQVLCHLKKQRRNKVIFNSTIIDMIDKNAIMRIRDKQHEDWFDALRDCIFKLSHTDRQLIKMRYYKDIDVKSLASRLGYSFQTIYRNLSRINGLLAECVQRTIGRGIS